MKKLLGISVIAMLAVSPMMANAAPVAGSPASGTALETGRTDGPKFGLVEANAENDAKLATAGYVKGAYNASINAVNKVAEGIVATVDAATASGDIEANVSGTATGTVNSTISGTAAGTVNSTVAGTAAGTVSSTVSGTASGTASGNVVAMNNWADQSSGNIPVSLGFSGASVTGTATAENVELAVTGTGTANNVALDVTGSGSGSAELSVSGSATASNVSLDVDVDHYHNPAQANQGA